MFKKFEWCDEYNMEHINIHVYKDSVNIHDSYKIKKHKHIKDVVNYIKTELSEHTTVSKINTIDLISEWKSHNLLYWLNIERDRTAHCDLNHNNIIYRVLYFIMSLFYFGQ